MAKNSNDIGLKGFDESKFSLGKGIKELDDVSNKLLREFNKGKISL